MAYKATDFFLTRMNAVAERNRLRGSRFPYRETDGQTNTQRKNKHQQQRKPASSPADKTPLLNVARLIHILL